MLLAGLESSRVLCTRLANILGGEVVLFRERVFPDGEVLVKADSPGKLAAHDSIVFCSRMYPQQNQALTKVLQSLDVIRDYSPQANLTLAVPYLPYVRQDKRFLEGEAISLKMLLRLFHLFSIQRLVTIDTHCPESLRNVAPFDFVEVSASVELTRKILDGPLAGSDTLLVAPDKGGIERARATAKEVGLDCVHIEKRRDRDTGEVSGVLPSELNRGYSSALVLDDIISTGGTMVLASQLLRKAGVRDLVAAATHLLLREDAGRRLLSSGYRDVVGTDSIETVFSRIGCEVFLAKALRGE